MIDPSTRIVSDVKHTVTAAASSSSKSRAKQFLETCKCPSSAAAYGSYEELVKDPAVDIVYVATPHSHHYQNTMLCLLAGKHVLCEKAFTVNAAQAKKLVKTAREKKLFLMEAVWTRFFPLSIEIRRKIESGELGAIHRVIADLSFAQDVENTWGADGAKHRMVNMDLAGGAMLDRTSPFAFPHFSRNLKWLLTELNPQSGSIHSHGASKASTTPCQSPNENHPPSFPP